MLIWRSMVTAHMVSQHEIARSAKHFPSWTPSILNFKAGLEPTSSDIYQMGKTIKTILLKEKIKNMDQVINHH